MKRFTSFFLSLVMLISLTTTFAVEGNDYGGLSTANVILQDTNGTTISKEEFNYLRNAVPAVKDCPRFVELSQINSDYVELSPEDIWMLFLHSGDNEAIENTIAAYQNCIVQIQYNGNGEFSASAKKQQPVQSAQPYGGSYRWTEGGNAESRILGGMGSDHGYGLRVNVTATFERYYSSPTSYGVKFLGYTTEKETLSDYYQRDTIKSEHVTHSEIGRYGPTANFSYYFVGNTSGSSTKVDITANP